MRAIYKRELQSYFTSMIGCIFIAVLIAFLGIYFMAYNMGSGYPYFSVVLSSVLFIFLVAVPILTMRSFAEERRSRTDQLLLTAPVSVTKIVAGKFLAMVTVFAIPCVVCLVYPVIISSQGEAHFLVDYSSTLAFFLLGCVFISIGMFLSSLTESQIIAAIATFGVLLLLYLWGALIDFLPSAAITNVIALILISLAIVLVVYQMTRSLILSLAVGGVCIAACLVTYFVKQDIFESLLSKMLGSLVLTDVLSNFSSNYLFDLKGLLMYLSLIFLFCFLTVQSVQKRRWS